MEAAVHFHHVALRGVRVVSAHGTSYSGVIFVIEVGPVQPQGNPHLPTVVTAVLPSA